MSGLDVGEKETKRSAYLRGIMRAKILGEPPPTPLEAEPSRSHHGPAPRHYGARNSKFIERRLTPAQEAAREKTSKESGPPGRYKAA